MFALGWCTRFEPIVRSRTVCVLLSKDGSYHLPHGVAGGVYSVARNLQSVGVRHVYALPAECSIFRYLQEGPAQAGRTQVGAQWFCTV